MRIRQIKPAFWSDARLAELPEATRLFYIGLWMIADDAGWLRWDAIEAARDLYGYETRHRREKRVVAMFDSLVESRRVIHHPCGHVEIPAFTTHQRLSGPTRQVRTAWKEHESCVSPQVPANPRDTPQSPASPRPVRNGIGTEREQGTERNGIGTGKGSAPANTPDGAVALTDEEHLEPFLRVVVPS